MSLTIHKQPTDIVLTGNPVAVNVSSNTVTQSDHKIHVRIIFSAEVLAEDSLPVVNNFANFDISDYLKSLKSLPLTVFGLFAKTIQNVAFMLAIFQIDVFETYNGDGLEHNKISIPPFSVMQGGFSTIFLNNYQASNRNFYNNYLTEDKKFLTWQPEKKLTWNQHDFLFFIPIFVGKQNIYGRFTLYYSDATTSIIDTEDLLAGGKSPYYLNTSILAHGLLSGETPTKKLVKYEVVINDAADDPLTEIRTYYVDKTYYNQQRMFIYKNSFGVYDQIMLKGMSESVDEIQRTVGFFQDQDFISDSEFTESYNANSGFLTTQYKNARTAKKYVAELVNSREIFEILGAELIPVIPTSKKVNIIKDDEFLYSFPFEYKYAYSDEFFAPFDDKQYFNPIMTYRNGAVSNAIQGQTAVLDFEAMLNADANVDFEINWGPDVGITNLNTNMVDGVWQALQTSILIPDNASLNQQIEITDSIGGRFLLDYTIIEAIVIDVDMSILVQQGYTLQFASGTLNAAWGDGTADGTFITNSELIHNYLGTGFYKISIYGTGILNITKFIANNNRILFISGMKSGLLTQFTINDNLYVGVIDLSNSPTSVLFRVDNNPGLTEIIHATSGNELIIQYEYDNCNISTLNLINQKVGGALFGHNNPNHTTIFFALSGNTKFTQVRLHDCDLTGVINFTNNPIGGTFYTYNNPNLTGFIFSLTGNTVITDFRIQNSGLAGTLELTNVPVGNIFWPHDNNLTNILFSVLENTALLQGYCDDNALQNLDFLNFPNSTPTIRMFGNGMNAPEHDNQLINLDNTGWNNGTLQIIPGNTPRTAASDAAYNNLLVKGWTIT